MLVDPGLARTRVLRAPARPRRPGPVGELRHQWTPRLAAAMAPLPNFTSWPSPRPNLRVPLGLRPRMAPSTLAKEHARPLPPGRLSALRSRSWRPTGVEDHPPARQTASLRHPSSRVPFLHTTKAAKTHMADGIVITPSHNPPERRRVSNTTPSTADRLILTSRSGCRTGPTNSCRRRQWPA